MIARECLNKLDDRRNTENWEWHDEVWCRSQGTRMLISVKHCYFFQCLEIEGNLEYLSLRMRLTKICGCMPLQHTGLKIRKLDHIWINLNCKANDKGESKAQKILSL